MGMYTGLRFKGIIKEEYKNDIDKLINGEMYWKDLDNEIFQSFSKVNRSDFIPYGVLVAMPKSWKEPTGKKDSTGYNITKDTDGFDRKFNIETRLLTFQCSLKDYDDTIEYFLEHILSIICEKSYHIEVLYEENSVSDMYKIEYGKLIRLEKSIRYNDYDTEINPFTGEEVYLNDKYYDLKGYDFSYGGSLC